MKAYGLFLKPDKAVPQFKRLRFEEVRFPTLEGPRRSASHDCSCGKAARGLGTGAGAEL